MHLFVFKEVPKDVPINFPKKVPKDVPKYLVNSDGERMRGVLIEQDFTMGSVQPSGLNPIKVGVGPEDVWRLVINGQTVWPVDARGDQHGDVLTVHVGSRDDRMCTPVRPVQVPIQNQVRIKNKDIYTWNQLKSSEIGYV